MAIVTISRQFGAGGRTLGEMAAKELGYEFLDDAVIQELSKRVGRDECLIANMEKNDHGFLSRVVSGMIGRNYMDRVANETPCDIDEVLYVDKLDEVINDLAAQDNVVLLGRGSQFILSGHPEAVHFLLIADEPQRMEFMQRRYNLSGDRARREIIAGEKRRRHLYTKMGCTNYDDPHNYHMVLNMSRISLEEAEKFIVMLTKKKEHEPIIPSSKKTMHN